LRRSMTRWVVGTDPENVPVRCTGMHQDARVRGLP
jgi:hypothetical protein